MALDIFSQIQELITASQNILITFPNTLPAGDNLCAGLSLKQAIEAQDKKADIASVLDLKKYDFLESEAEIKDSLQILPASVVRIKKDIKNFYYEKENSNLIIYLTPQSGRVSPQDILLEKEKFPYDLIITLNTSDLNALQELFEKNTDFFYETPIINIDLNSANENYGQINLINLKSASICEIIFELISKLYPESIDQKTATFLYCGLIEKTNCFKSIKITPQALNTAIQLLELKADKDLIIKNMYQNKSVSQIKLWGRALARLKHSQEHNIYWSLIDDKDFDKSKADAADFAEVFSQFLAQLPEADFALLFAHLQGQTYVAVKPYQNNQNLEMLFLEHHPKPVNGCLFFEVEKPLLEVERMVLEKIYNT